MKKEKDTKRAAEPLAPKMRIMLLDENLVTQSDRLIDQSFELKNGPKEKHEGPVRVELTLTSKGETEEAIAWLSRLSGKLPLIEKTVGKRGRKPGLPKLLDKEPIKELMHEALAKGTDQTKLVAFLREKGFVFLTAQRIKDFKIPIEFKSPLHEKYQFLVRQTKKAKDIKNDKFDPQLAFGIRLIGGPSDKVLIYLYGKHLKTVDIKAPKKIDANIKPQRFLVFPHYMTEDERIRFSQENAKLKSMPDLAKSKFYLRWEPHVKLR